MLLTGIVSLFWSGAYTIKPPVYGIAISYYTVHIKVQIIGYNIHKSEIRKNHISIYCKQLKTKYTFMFLFKKISFK